MHVGIGEAALASDRLEIGDARDPGFELIEVGFEAEGEEGVTGFAMEDVGFDDVVAVADVFEFEVGEDLIFGIRSGVPFWIADLAGGFDNENGVVRGIDDETGVLGFADAVEGTVAVVDVEAVDAFGFFDQKTVDGDGFVANLTGGREDGIRGRRGGAQEEVRDGDGADAFVASERVVGTFVMVLHVSDTTGIRVVDELGDLGVLDDLATGGGDGFGDVTGHGFRAGA